MVWSLARIKTSRKLFIYSLHLRFLSSTFIVGFLGIAAYHVMYSGTVNTLVLYVPD